MTGCSVPVIPKHDAKADGIREGTVGLIRTLGSGREDVRAPVLLMVHGSPGGAGAWRGYLSDAELKKAYRMVSYDRPGYGGTGRPSKKLSEQADALVAVIDQQQGRVDLVGHSYGGAVVLKAAARRPGKVGNVLLLAGSVAPGLSRTARLNSFVKYSGMQFLLPGGWKSSNEEVIALQQDLRELEPELKKVEAPVTVIQGGKDGLVVPGHVDYLKARLEHEPKLIFLENEGHFLPWKRFPLVKETLLGFRR